MLLLLKIGITPLLVAAVSLAARWWGPTIGGLLMGLPWFTGPTLFVLVHEKGIEFGAGACVGIQLGVVCVSSFMLAYGFISRAAQWPASLAGAVMVFAATAWAAQDPSLLPALTGGAIDPLWAATALALVALVVTYALLPTPRSPPLLQSLPWWDIPMRMATTAVLVAALMLTADVLGPQLSGVISTYPVILTVVGTFTHHRWGREAAWRVMSGLTKSLVMFVTFFLIVGLALPSLGLARSYVLASAVAITIAALLLFLNQRRPA